MFLGILSRFPLTIVGAEYLIAGGHGDGIWDRAVELSLAQASYAKAQMESGVPRGGVEKASLYETRGYR